MADQIVSAFNGIVLIMLSLPLLYVVVSPRFKTGIVLTLGFGAMGLSAAICGVWEINGIDPWEAVAMERAQAIGTLGLLICIWGWLHDALRDKDKPRRRKSDLMAFDPEVHHHARRQQ